MNRIQAMSAFVITVLGTSCLAGAADPDADLAGQLVIRAGSRDEAMRGAFVVDVAKGSWRRVVGALTQKARVSPDGRTLAYCAQVPPKPPEGLWLCDIAGKEEPKQLAKFAGPLCWSPDGREVLVSNANPDNDGAVGTWHVRVDGQAPTRLEIPTAESVMDWSPDGRWLLTAARVDEPNAGLPRERFRAFVRKADGSDAHLLTESDGADDTYRFAPDSRQVVFIRREPGKSEFYSLWVVNRDGTELRKVIAGTPEIHPFFACWSPDGKRLAVNMIRTGQDDRGRPTSFDSHVQFFASDGKPGRRLDLPHAYVIPVDWR